MLYEFFSFFFRNIAHTRPFYKAHRQTHVMETIWIIRRLFSAQGMQAGFHPLEQLLLFASLKSWAHLVAHDMFCLFVFFACARCFSERSKFDLGAPRIQEPSFLHLAFAALKGLIEMCRFMLPANKEFAAAFLSRQGRQLNAHTAHQPLPTTQT